MDDVKGKAVLPRERRITAPENHERLAALQDRRADEHERWANTLTNGERGFRNIRRQGISYFKKLDEDEFGDWWGKAIMRCTKIAADEKAPPRDSIAALMAVGNLVEMKIKHGGESKHRGGTLNLTAENVNIDASAELMAMRQPVLEASNGR